MPNCAPNYLEAVGSSSDSAQGKGRGAAYRVACDRAHFYVQANKFGTLFTETDWPMQKNFRVQAKWFDDFVARAKLRRDASPWIVIGTSLDVTSSLPSSFTPST